MKAFKIKTILYLLSSFVNAIWSSSKLWFSTVFISFPSTTWRSAWYFLKVKTGLFSARYSQWENTCLLLSISGFFYYWITLLNTACQNRRNIWNLSDCNGILFYNHLVHNRTLNLLVRLTKWFLQICVLYLVTVIFFLNSYIHSVLVTN